MFTGLIEEVGTIESIIKSGKSGRMSIKADKVLTGTKVGDSISTNGVCLTVIRVAPKSFTADVMAETMRMSNLENLSSGDRVNLERALCLSERVGGHMVSGHIDGLGIITKIGNEDNAIWITIETSGDLLRYIVKKGSIAIDGVSLTVAYVDAAIFKVAIIPHTKSATTLEGKKAGDQVNLECDIVGKYIEKLLMPSSQKTDQENIHMDFLNKYGFL